MLQNRVKCGGLAIGGLSIKILDIDFSYRVYTAECNVITNLVCILFREVLFLSYVIQRVC